MRTALFSLALLSTIVSITALEDPYMKRQAANNPNLSKYYADISAYATSLAASPTYTSILDGIAATDPNLLSSLAAFEATAAQNPTAGVTAAPDFFSSLPEQYRGFFESVYSVQISIARVDGVLTSTIETHASTSTTAGRVGPASTTVDSATRTMVGTSIGVGIGRSTSMITTGPMTSARMTGMSTSRNSSSSTLSIVQGSAADKAAVRISAIGAILIGFLGLILTM